MEGNVVSLRSDYAVVNDIEDFINGLETDNTKKRYSDNIAKFVKWKWDVPLEFLSVDQINALTYTDMKKFSDSMRRKYSAGTVNNIMTTIYSLLRELKRVQNQDTGVYVYDIEDVDKLRVKRFRDNNVRSAGYLEWEEVSEWIMFLEDSNISNNIRKAMFFRIARLTGMRKQSIVDLKFSDLRKDDGIYVLQSYTKGKRHRISIPNELAESILELKRLGDTNDSRILGLSVKTIERTFDMILKEFEVEESRNITLHSLRNLSAWEVYLSSGRNILSVQQHLGHSDIQVAYSYIKERESFALQPTLYINEDLNCDVLESLSKEQLIDLMNSSSRATKYEVLNKAKNKGLI